jgi:hypothetical protein
VNPACEKGQYRLGSGAHLDLDVMLAIKAIYCHSSATGIKPCSKTNNQRTGLSAGFGVPLV